jgi:hypothetical protein
MARTCFGATETEESRTETGQVRLLMCLECVGVHLGKQSNEELIVLFGPGHPETHSTEPKQNPFHVQLFDGLATRMRNIQDNRTTYHHSENVVSEAIFVNMVSPRLAVLVEGDFE